MTLSRWDPFEDLTRIQERMNRMFEDSLGRTRGELSGETGRWVPAVDIYETPERVVLLADDSEALESGGGQPSSG